MNTHPCQNRIEKIIKRNLEDLAGWERPDVKKGLGPYFPDVFDEFEADLNAATSHMRQVLSKASEDELTAEFDFQPYSFQNKLTHIQGAHDFTFARRLKTMKERKPAWFAGGWNVASKRGGFAQWCKRESLTLNEVALLSAGIDPSETDFDKVFLEYGKDSRTDEVLYYLEYVYDSIARGLNLDLDCPKTVPLLEIYAWIKSNRFSIDPMFRKALDTRFKGNALSETFRVGTGRSGEKSMHGATYKLHARILFAIAKSKFGLEDAAQISRVAREIERAVHLEGMTAEPKLIRGLLWGGFEQAMAAKGKAPR